MGLAIFAKPHHLHNVGETGTVVHVQWIQKIVFKAVTATLAMAEIHEPGRERHLVFLKIITGEFESFLTSLSKTCTNLRPEDGSAAKELEFISYNKRCSFFNSFNID